jgi:hypothetical protein
MRPDRRVSLFNGVSRGEEEGETKNGVCASPLINRARLEKAGVG